MHAGSLLVDLPVCPQKVPLRGLKQSGDHRRCTQPSQSCEGVGLMGAASGQSAGKAHSINNQWCN